MRDMLKIWNMPDTPGYGFNATSTLMIDDSNMKMREYPENLLKVPEFTEELVVNGSDDTLVVLQSILRKLLQVVGTCIDVDSMFDIRVKLQEFQWEIEQLYIMKK